MVKSKGAVSERMLVALICCLMVTTATGQPEREVRISIDWDMAGICMVLLMVLGALVVWEGIKWGCVQIYHEYLPGSTQRKLRRLQRIRDATAMAIQRELERIGDSGSEFPKDHRRPRQRPTTDDYIIAYEKELNLTHTRWCKNGGPSIHYEASAYRIPFPAANTTRSTLGIPRNC